MELKIGTVEPYILFIRNTYNLRFFSADETADADSMNMVARVEHYFKKAWVDAERGSWPTSHHHQQPQRSNYQHMKCWCTGGAILKNN